MKKANDFQIAKVQFQGVASLSLNFLPVSALCCLTIKVLLIKKACSSCCRVLLNYIACKKKNQRSCHLIKKEEISSYLVYNIASFGKMTGKTESFLEDKVNMNFQSNI